MSRRELVPATVEQRAHVEHLRARGRDWRTQKLCPHGNTVRGFLMARNGARHDALFCWECGRKVDVLRKADTAPVWDLCFSGDPGAKPSGAYSDYMRGELGEIRLATGQVVQGRWAPRHFTVSDWTERSLQMELASQLGGLMEVHVPGVGRADIVTQTQVIEVKPHAWWGFFDDRVACPVHQARGYAKALGLEPVVAYGSFPRRPDHLSALIRSCDGVECLLYVSELNCWLPSDHVTPNTFGT